MSSKKSSKRSGKKLKYAKQEMLSYDDEKDSRSSDSSSSESYSSSSSSQSYSSSCSSSDEGKSGMAYGNRKRRRRHKKEKKERMGYGSSAQKPAVPAVPSYAGEKPESGKRMVKATLTSASDLSPVKVIDSAELDDMQWGKTTYLIKVEGSLAELQERAGYDSAGNQRPLPLFLGHGLRVDGTTDDVHARIESNRAHPKATHEKMFHSAHALADHRDVVRRVTVTGHNKFPGSVEVTLHNLQGSANNVQFSSAAGGATQALVIRAEAGEKFENRTLMRNDLTEEDINHLQYYSNATLKSLGEGVMPAQSRNGAEQVLVPARKGDPNKIVIDEICRYFKDDPRCDAKMRETILKTGEIPSDVILPSKDSPGCVILAKDLFEDYKQRCASSLKKNRPTSDLAHPHGHFTRVIAEKHFTSESAKIKSSSAMDDAACKLWDNEEGTQVGLVSAVAKQNAMTKIHSAWFRVNVYHAPIDQIASEEK